ncbi:MAG: hypothetical protein HY525_00205 [Betaproteobacteria bacterium]|nr:hypothetical protein [Betaproteobacteria bacterium]
MNCASTHGWLFLAVFLVPTSFAHADWVKYAANYDGTYYFDPTRIRKTGKLQLVWELDDRILPVVFTKERRGGTAVLDFFFSSAKNLYALNCESGMYAIVSQVLHQEQMGAGTVVYSYDKNEKDWEFKAAPPRSMIEDLLGRVCAPASAKGKAK